MSSLTFLKGDSFALPISYCSRCYHPNYTSIDTVKAEFPCQKCKTTIKHSTIINQMKVALNKANLSNYPKDTQTPYCPDCFKDYLVADYPTAADTKITCNNCQKTHAIVLPNDYVKKLLPLLQFTIGKTAQPLPIPLRASNQIKCSSCGSALEGDIHNTEVQCKYCNTSNYLSVEQTLAIYGNSYMPRAVFFAFDFDSRRVLNPDELQYDKTFTKDFKISPNKAQFIAIEIFLLKMQKQYFEDAIIQIPSSLTQNKETIGNEDMTVFFENLKQNPFYYLTTVCTFGSYQNSYKFISLSINAIESVKTIDINLHFTMTKSGSKKEYDSIVLHLENFVKAQMSISPVIEEAAPPNLLHFTGNQTIKMRGENADLTLYFAAFQKLIRKFHETIDSAISITSLIKKGEKNTTFQPLEGDVTTPILEHIADYSSATFLIKTDDERIMVQLDSTVTDHSFDLIIGVSCCESSKNKYKTLLQIANNFKSKSEHYTQKSKINEDKKEQLQVKNVEKNAEKNVENAGFFKKISKWFG